jgi:hypothetical protein
LAVAATQEELEEDDDEEEEEGPVGDVGDPGSASMALRRGGGGGGGGVVGRQGESVTVDSSGGRRGIESPFMVTPRGRRAEGDVAHTAREQISGQNFGKAWGNLKLIAAKYLFLFACLDSPSWLDSIGIFLRYTTALLHTRPRLFVFDKCSLNRVDQGASWIYDIPSMICRNHEFSLAPCEIKFIQIVLGRVFSLMSIGSFRTFWT